MFALESELVFSVLRSLGICPQVVNTVYTSTHILRFVFHEWTESCLCHFSPNFNGIILHKQLPRHCQKTFFRKFPAFLVHCVAGDWESQLIKYGWKSSITMILCNMGFLNVFVVNTYCAPRWEQGGNVRSWAFNLPTENTH